MQKSCQSSNVKVTGQGHRGQKNKSVAFCLGVRGTVLVWHFSGGVIRGAALRQFCASGKISACYLVNVIITLCLSSEMAG